MHKGGFKRLLKTGWIHALLWSLTFFALLNALQRVDNFSKPNDDILIPLLIGFGFSLLVFYINSELLAFRLAQRNQLVKYYLSSLLLVFLISAVEWWVDTQYYQWKKPDSAKIEGNFFLPNLIINSLVWILSYCYWLTKSWMQAEKRRNELAEAQLQHELDFLKASISPHFFFNSLNVIYAEALKDKKSRIADKISRLAGLMRYMVYETGAPRVGLGTEVSFIKDYLKIWEERIEKGRVNINFNEQIDESAQIAPMLLLPLIENACKYGVNGEVTSAIDIQVRCEVDEFELEVVNDYQETRAQDAMELHKGFGLKNLKDRLKLLYPGKFELETYQLDERFVAKLRLKL